MAGFTLFAHWFVKSEGLTFERYLGMAFFARHFEVRAFQLEGCIAIVYKRACLPPSRRMALFTGSFLSLACASCPVLELTIMNIRMTVAAQGGGCYKLQMAFSCPFLNLLMARPASHRVVLPFELESSLLVVEFYLIPTRSSVTVFTAIFCKKRIDFAFVRILVAPCTTQRSEMELHGFPLSSSEQLVVTLYARDGQMPLIKGILGLLMFLNRETGGRKAVFIVTCFASLALASGSELPLVIIFMTIRAGLEPGDF